MKIRFIALFLLGALVTAPAARANGRFPNANGFREIDAETLVLTGTYGLLISTNGGADFYFECEADLFGKPPGTYTMDPLLELDADRRILSGSRHAVRVSRDLGCSFETDPSLPRNWGFFELERPEGAAAGQIVDLSRRGRDESAPVIALVALLGDDGRTSEHRLFESDASRAFSPMGTAILPALMDYGFTLDAAPSDPERIYVTGTASNDPILLVSDDGGRNFVPLPLVFDDPEYVLGAYIGGISPNDADELYLRVVRRVPMDDGLYYRDDSLAASRDGGKSFEEVLREPSNLLAFALSLDGGLVLAGFGDPRADETLSVPEASGLYRARSTDLAFERVIPDMDVSCLAFTERGLYACAVERDPLGVGSAPDFHLGLFRGSGAPASATDLSPLLKLRDVRGPAPWADGRESTCLGAWRGTDPSSVIGGVCAQLNACETDDTAGEEGALVCGEGGQGEAGTPGAPATPPVHGGGGCGCRFASPAVERDNALFALVALSFYLGRRRINRVRARSAGTRGCLRFRAENPRDSQRRRSA